MVKPRIGNSELISAVNSRLILEAVRVHQPTFRAAVARHTGLKPATVTVIVNDLIKHHMLEEVEAAATEASAINGTSRWGRPPLMLQVNGNVKRILAVDFEPDRIRVALTNILIEGVIYREQAIDRFAEPKAILPIILSLCEEVLEGVPRSQILGAGVSLPGVIDTAQGLLVSSTNMPRWQNVPIAAKLKQALKVPIHIERSLHLAALYEDWSNPQNHDKTTLILSLRTGVGMGIMHRGNLYVGNMGLDGEIGHTVIDLNGRQCECGSRGCLETFVSASAVTTRAQEMIDVGRGKLIKKQVDAGIPLTPELVYRLAKQGDADSGVIVREIGRYLGIATANLINLLAPHDVVICGSIDTADELLLHAVSAEVDKNVLPRTRENVTLRLARETDRLPLLGAAVLVARQIFALPTLSHNSAALNDDAAVHS